MEAVLKAQASSLSKPAGLFPAAGKAKSPISNRRSAAFVSLPHLNRQISLKNAVRCSQTAVQEKHPNRPATGPAGPARLFVGLPLDSVSSCNTPNHTGAISAGLRALKLLGAHGVDLPVFWSVVQPSAGGSFDWSAYLALARTVRDAGLHLRVSLNLYGTTKGLFGLPEWVRKIAEGDPDVRFADRTGRRSQGCLSFAVDELPLLGGRTPVEAFSDFFSSFVAAFGDHIGTTITDISIGLGPDGELRYPSLPPPTKSRSLSSVGEFQCFDKYMLAHLKTQAEKAGNPLWGLSGPHDVPDFYQSPDTPGFFNENGGSWATPYGDFFLSWYSSQLLAHGNRLLSLASNVFGHLPATLSARIPLLHCWHDTQSRPAQLTAGYYNSDGRDGYDSVAEMFARNSCQMIVPGMDLADQDQPTGLRANPESLLSQITNACKRHGVKISGENSRLSGNGFGRVKERSLALDSYTYQRMGADFFSPEHWPLFVEFVRSMTEPEMDADDLVSEEESKPMTIGTMAAKDREMQAV